MLWYLAETHSEKGPINYTLAAILILSYMPEDLEKCVGLFPPSSPSLMSAAGFEELLHFHSLVHHRCRLGDMSSKRVRPGSRVEIESRMAFTCSVEVVIVRD